MFRYPEAVCTMGASDWDIRLSNYVIGYLIMQALNLFVKLALPFSILGWSAISKGVLALLLLFALKPIFCRSLMMAFILEALMFVLFLISLLTGLSDPAFILQTMFTTLIVLLPLGFCLYSIADNTVLYKRLRMASYIISAILLPTLYFDTREYSMSCATALALANLFIWDAYFKQKKWYSLLIALIDTVAITIWGNRSALICVFIYFCLYFVLGSKMSFKKMLLFIFMLVIGILFLANWDSISISAYSFLRHNLKLHSRTLIQLLSGAFFTDESRLWLFGHYWELINQHPLFGWGLLGGWIGEGSGPHNILIEFMLAFGYIIGGLLCAFSISFLSLVFIEKDDTNRSILMVFTAYAFPIYLVAGGFLTSVRWIAFLFICLRYLNTVNKQRLARSVGQDLRFRSVERVV